MTQESKEQASVCVVGAAVSGLPTIKQLKSRGISFDCFEMGSDIGGIWRYDNDSGRSPAYASLHIDTSKERFAYADLPMPKAWPAYLHHTQVLEYLEKYADLYALKPLISFGHRVESAVRVGDAWSVTVRNLSTGESFIRSYEALVVASGHHWDPNLPDNWDAFGGETLHASQYRTPDPHIGKDVVVVGVGNTGADIASELSWHANSVTISARSGAHILPRYIFGQPLDALSSRLSSRVPIGAQRAIYRVLLRVAQGSQESYGFPLPDAPLLSQHPTVSEDLLGLVKDGQVDVQKGISRFDGDEVVFLDGKRSRADVIIYATGYRISFPFLDASVFQAEGNKVELYRQVVSVDVPDLYFVGLIQPVGALPPLAEQQARWVAQIVDGADLPTSGEMRAAISAAAEERSKRYQDRPRHTIQVDYWPYLDEMRNACDANER